MTFFSPTSTQPTPRRLRKTLTWLLRSIRRAFFPTAFEQAMREFDRRRADAIRRGCTQDIGRVAKDRRAFTHGAIKG